LTKSPKGGQKTTRGPKKQPINQRSYWLSFSGQPGWSTDGRIIWCLELRAEPGFLYALCLFKFQSLLVEFPLNRAYCSASGEHPKPWILTLLAELFYIVSKSTLQHFLSIAFLFINAPNGLGLNTVEV
jgi:hypothetical protein